MPEFLVQSFKRVSEIEMWLNGIRQSGFFVRIEAFVIDGSGYTVAILKYVPSKMVGTPAGDVSQPETWIEPVIEADE